MKDRKQKKSGIWLLTGLVLCMMMIMTGCSMIPKAHAAEPEMTITAIDLGSDPFGDATVLTSGGKTLLMDTGLYDSNRTVINYLKNNGMTTLDLYVSHYHDDHDSYVPEIIRSSSFNVGTLYLPDPQYIIDCNEHNYDYAHKHYKQYKEMVKAAQEEGVQIVYLSRGSSFTIGTAQFEVLWGCEYDDGNYDTHTINSNSLVTMVTCGDIRFLTCGDIEKGCENQILNAGIDIRADIFKASHHGAVTSNSYAFCKAVNPSYSWWNCCDEDSSHFASGGGQWVKGTKDNLENFSNNFSVRYNGNITFRVKDGTIRVSAKRNTKQITETIGTKEVTYTYCNASSWKLTEAMKRMEQNGMWVIVDGVKHYVFEDGTYATDTIIADQNGSVYVDENGDVKTGLFYDSQEKNGYYADDDGILQKSWQLINGKWYYFGGDYAMKTGWFQDKGKWYYFNGSGVMMTGWGKFSGVWYYLDDNGVMQTGWVLIRGSWYYFDSNGAMKTGWIYTGNKWYYLSSNGDMQTGWLNYNNNWYYLEPNGVMVTGKKTIDGMNYEFNDSGAMTVGIVGEEEFEMDGGFEDSVSMDAYSLGF